MKLRDEEFSGDSKTLSVEEHQIKYHRPLKVPAFALEGKMSTHASVPDIRSILALREYSNGNVITDAQAKVDASIDVLLLVVNFRGEYAFRLC